MVNRDKLMKFVPVTFGNMTLDGLNALQLEYNLGLITLCLPLVVAFSC
jgi:hypothetical protein